eukprot:2780385-Alexandrium_andersonii.AAC.1
MRTPVVIGPAFAVSSIMVADHLPSSDSHCSGGILHAGLRDVSTASSESAVARRSSSRCHSDTWPAVCLSKTCQIVDYGSAP